MTVTHSWATEADPQIPLIGDQDLFAFNEQITHLVQRDGRFVVARHESGPTLRTTSCIWDPELGEERQIAPDGHYRVPFFVSCGYYGFFKPSIAEVASQTPMAEIAARNLNAFYIADHIDILKSGGFLRATAIFVRAL